MITQIGVIAGEIWQYLEKHASGVTLDDIRREINEPEDQLLMSLGWLDREGHIIMEKLADTAENKSNYRITLRKK